MVSAPSVADNPSATTLLSDASAPQVSESPSGSLKYPASSTVSASSLKSIRAGIVSVTTGGRLGTATWKRCVANSPSSSVAVTVTTASPFATPVTVTALSDTDAATTALSDTVAM